MLPPPEPNYETVTVRYDRRSKMWGFPTKDDPKMYLWVSTEFMQEAPTLFISQLIYSQTKRRVTESQLRFLSTYDSDLILPVISRVVFEYPEGAS